ncbi:hypothetical protein TYRP_012755 [Tyrophagus putrescentiae]|nr:hypothetical protein TYRP_012755 [Tyrophagus putrescentiae]
MFYILTFSYAVIVIGPLLLCLLVPGTIAEKKKKKAKDKDEKDDDDEEEEEEEKGKKYRWSNHIALSRRLTELTREHFEGLFYDWSPPPPSPLVDSSDAHSSSVSPSSSASSVSPNDQPPNPLHQAAALWLRQTDHLLVQSTPDWPSLISLRNGLQAVEREQGAAISSLQRSLLTVQKALLPLITAARRQQRQNQQQSSSSQHLSHHSSDLLEQSETLLRGWCRRVKALKTLHV